MLCTVGGVSRSSCTARFFYHMAFSEGSMVKTKQFHPFITWLKNSITESFHKLLFWPIGDTEPSVSIVFLCLRCDRIT